MKKKTVKKVVLWTLASVFVLFVVVCAHIYVMMKPKAPDAHTVAMARIDFKQQMTAADATTVTAWLYAQQGVAHVLCNPVTKIAVFTFYPVKANADNITANLKNSLHYNASRVVPSAKEMSSGCPMAATSFTYKVYNIMSKIL